MVNAGSEIDGTTLWVRNLLISGVADPISGTRASDEKFVMTSYPQRPVKYPYITVEVDGISQSKLGIASQGMITEIPVEVRVWSQSTKQRDRVSGEVINVLRNNQLNVSSGASSEGLFDYKLINTTNIDEEGNRGIHSKVIESRYKFITI